MTVSERKTLQPAPSFGSEDQEREFWASNDSSDHIDWSRAKPVTFSRLKPRRGLKPRPRPG